MSSPDDQVHSFDDEDEYGEDDAGSDGDADEYGLDYDENDDDDEDRCCLVTSSRTCSFEMHLVAMA